MTCLLRSILEPVANTENPYNQVKAVSNNFEISNHAFVNQLVAGLQKKIGIAVPGLTVGSSAKEATKGKISMIVTGQIIVDDSESLSDVDERVRQVMNSIKNPADLISMIRNR